MNTDRLINMQKKLKMYIQNVSGISSQIPELRAAIESSDYDVIILIETWLKLYILSSELFDPQVYQVFRCDRAQCSDDPREGGGVLIAVKLNLSPEKILQNCASHIEQEWVRIRLANKSVVVGAAYIPPTVNEAIAARNLNTNMTVEEFYSKFIDNVETACNLLSPEDELFVAGDFNAATEWIKDTENPLLLRPLNLIGSPQTFFVDGMSQLGLSQICDVKTVNQLENIWTSETANFSVSHASLCLKPNSHHHAAIELIYKVDHHDDSYDADSLRYNFHLADIDGIKSELNGVDWSEVLIGDDVDDIVDKFYGVLYPLIDRFVPKRRTKHKYKCRWMNPSLARLRNRRNRSFNTYRRNPTSYNLQHFLRCSDEFQLLNAQLYGNYLQGMATELKNDPKSFWKFVNKKRSVSGLPMTMHLDGTECNDTKNKADLFAKFFSTVFSPKDESFNPDVNSQPILSNIEFTTDDVEKVLRNLDINKGAGPDMIPNNILKFLSSSLAVPLQYIFNNSLATGKFPSIWKDSFVTPIFKSGDRDNIRNYRGVALQSAIPKAFEQLVVPVLDSTFQHLLKPQQHGFREGHSTITNLMTFADHVLNCMNNGGQVDTVYLDFAKAFDRVDHNLLLQKLNGLGISGALLAWLTSYLDDRPLRVRIGSVNSFSFTASSGVPQGSHLGPLLFILFINDIGNVIDGCESLWYADDVKLFKKIESTADHGTVQSCINSIVDWCSRNKMQLNADKCEVITFTRCRRPLLADYFINGQQIKRAKVVNDLGVLFDDQLNFKAHIDHTITRSKSLLGFVKRQAKEFQCPYVTKSIYTCLVRSVLEYGCIVWSPMYDGDIKRLESVQKQFLLFALRGLGWRHSFLLPSYTARLSLLNMDSLEDRRKLLCCSFVHNYLSGAVAASFDFVFDQPLRNTRSTTVPKLKRQPLVRSRYVDNSPSRRCIQLFNEFCAVFVPGGSLGAFKRNMREKFRRQRLN